MNIRRVDISGPWKPGTIGMGIYGEAKLIIVKQLNRPDTNSVKYSAVTAKIMGYIDSAGKIADQAISDMMFGDTHKT